MRAQHLAFGGGLVAFIAACSTFSAATDERGAEAPQDASAGAGDTGTTRQDAAVDSGAYAAAVLADHPILYLRLGEATGLAAADTSGKGHVGAYVGNVVRGIPGAIASEPDTAVRFGAGAQEVRIVPAIDFPGRVPFTLEAWVRPEAPQLGDINAVVSNWKDIGARGGWSLYMQYEVIRFARSNADGGAEGPPEFNGLPHIRFSHIVGTYDGETMRLYVDGLDVGQAESKLNVPAPASTDVLTIANNFAGSVDDVAVYDYALSAARVGVHHTLGAAP